MADEVENKTPEAVTQVFGSALGFLSTYGWTIVFIFVVANLLWSHFQPKWQQWRERVVQQQQDTEYHRNPDLLIQRQEELAVARQRLQEQHDRLAQVHAEKAKELEEKKRREKIEQWEQLQRGTSPINNQTTQSGSSSNSLQGNFNPLMGFGSGTSYRPSRRGGSSGGG